MPRKKILLLQLGSPLSPKIGDVRRYLRDFLGDPRVVDTNPWIWKPIFYLFVLPFRPYKSARAYGRIWDGRGFPLVNITTEFARKVQKEMGDTHRVYHAFLPGTSSIEKVLEEGIQATEEEWLVIPLFPQYAESTTAAAYDALAASLKKRVLIPRLTFNDHFFSTKAFIDNSVLNIKECLEKEKKRGTPIDALVFSFHGIPKRRVLFKGDPYYRHCYETFALLKMRIQNIEPQNMFLTFQSRFGQEEWLTPYTDIQCLELIAQGHKRLALCCPSFVADCLETVDEIGLELKDKLMAHGGELVLIPCLNTRDSWCHDFAKWIRSMLESPTGQGPCYTLSLKDSHHMPPQEPERPPLSDSAKKTLKIVFLTLFLDLIGFSIIFPLFPALIEHYLTVDGDNIFLRTLFDWSTRWADAGGGAFSGIVLFGGVLGALYSLLQFIAAPLWGALSDRIGRRPVLLISVGCLALSYGLWFFAGTFTLLILSRFIGGIMGGNISTATAVVADVTDRKNRSRGMAVIGIAFAMGFIFGPALGGILSMIDLTDYHSSLADWGINPFSMPAALACFLGLFNLCSLAKNFKETLPQEKRGRRAQDRSINPFVLFRPLPYPGVNLTNLGHFLFLSAFAGMEFTLTFLAVERLGYSSMDNALMFIFVGIVIALVQGGFIRRKAHQMGEKKIALMGLTVLLPGMGLIAYAHSTWVLYVGLFFLSVGSAMIIPTLTALVSLYTPPEYQGKSVGIFRSLGALARVLGPLAASFLYWKYGPEYPYLLGGAFLLLPLVLIARLPSVSAKN